MSSRLLMCLILVSSLCACAVKPKPDRNTLINELDGPLAQLQVDTRQLYQRLQRLTSDKACVKEQDCQVIGIGVQTCGMPEQYLVFSKKHTDQRLLDITNERYSRLKQAQQNRLGSQASCAPTVKPEAYCQVQQCVVRP